MHALLFEVQGLAGHTAAVALQRPRESYLEPVSVEDTAAALPSVVLYWLTTGPQRDQWAQPFS